MTADQVTNASHRLVHFISHQFKATRKGHGVHSPFVYAICENVFYNEHPHYAFDQLDKLREELLHDEKTLDTGNFGAGSLYLRTQRRKIKDIAAKGISSKKQSEILYRLCNYLNPETIVELGTSLGLNTLYLAKQNPSARVITIEGSGELSVFAQQLAGKAGLSNIEFHTGLFEDKLPSILSNLKGGVLFYIDGNHTFEATMNYFKMILPHMKENCVMVFDDIYWSKGMTRAWNEVSAHPRVKLCIDSYYSGYLFFKEEFREKGAFKLVV